nr:hypothetical protein [uncultured Pseudomonas sp.]
MVINLPMGEDLSSFLESAPVEISSDCMDTLGLCYHEFEKAFSSTALPEVKVWVDSSPVEFKHVVGLSIKDDKERANGTINTISLTLRGVPSRSDVQVAKKFAYSVIRDILRGGWQRYIYRFDPRVSGAESVKFESYFDDLSRSLVMSAPHFDPHYEMSDEQWSKAGVYRWYFYKDGYYLMLNGWSSRDESDPVGQASYLFGIKVRSEKEFWLEAFASKDKGRWRELLPALLQKYASQRQATEEMAEKVGVEIDRAYRDGPIYVLDE